MCGFNKLVLLIIIFTMMLLINNNYGSKVNRSRNYTRPSLDFGNLNVLFLVQNFILNYEFIDNK